MEKNIKLVGELVGTKYKDFEGLVSIQKNDLNGISQLCRSHGVDLAHHFLLGFGFEFGEMKGDRTLTTITCKALILGEEYGTTYEEVAKNTKGISKVKASIQKFTLPISELGEYVKCFDCMGVSEISKEIAGLEIV